MVVGELVVVWQLRHDCRWNMQHGRMQTQPVVECCGGCSVVLVVVVVVIGGMVRTATRTVNGIARQGQSYCLGRNPQLMRPSRPGSKPQQGGGQPH